MDTSLPEIKEDIHKNNMRKLIVIVISLILLVLAILVSISVGYLKMSLEDVVNVLFFGERYIDGPYGPVDVRNIVFESRLPRVLCAMCIGAALSVSGAAMQGIFRNPMASPSVLGISSVQPLVHAYLWSWDSASHLGHLQYPPWHLYSHL